MSTAVRKLPDTVDEVYAPSSEPLTPPTMSSDPPSSPAGSSGAIASIFGVNRHARAAVERHRGAVSERPTQFLSTWALNALSRDGPEKELVFL